MPPEYAVHGSFSVKSDVFSFGVLVLEIISGRKNRGFSDPHHHLNLLGHVGFENKQTTLHLLVTTKILFKWLRPLKKK